MAQYFAKEPEKYVNNTVLYIDDVADAEYIYHDVDTTVKVTRSEMLEILKRGPVILYCDADKEFVCPQEWIDGGANSYVTAKIVALSDASPAVASFIKFYTKEYA